MPLPSSRTGKDLYTSSRDYFNRWRKWTLQDSGGDADALKEHVIRHLRIDAEFPQFREAVDFANQEGLLTPEQAEAAQNAIQWGEQLLSLMGGPVD